MVLLLVMQPEHNAAGNLFPVPAIDVREQIRDTRVDIESVGPNLGDCRPRKHTTQGAGGHLSDLQIVAVEEKVVLFVKRRIVALELCEHEGLE
ncbi:MAG: hypothetical protein GY811_30065 [Myxococcales bacterium]|nr:hypothetical protein [Myxococcales bacterium]